MIRLSIFRSLLLAVTALLLGAALPLAAQSAAAPAGAPTGAPDPGEDIRGAKALIEIPPPDKPPVALVSGIGGAAVALVLAWLWWRKRRRSQQRQDPRAIALAALAELASGREVLAAEPFANRAAQTVRQYIAERFGLAAPRRTTEEFLHELARDNAAGLTGESDHLRAFLKSCDLAKFAGARLDSSQRDGLLEAARAFITATAATTAAPVRLRDSTADERR